MTLMEKAIQMTDEQLRAKFTKSRIKQRHSLRDVDAIIGVPYSTLARFERGENSPVLDIRARIEAYANGDTSLKDRRKPPASIADRLKRIEEHLGLN